MLRNFLLALALMDLRNAPSTTNWDANLQDRTFFTYIHRMKRMSKPTFSNPCIWLLVHSSKKRTRQSANFIKRFLPEYETMHSVYQSSKNECLDVAKT